MIKRLNILLAVFVSVMFLTVPTAVRAQTTGTIAVKNETEGYSYELFQIFAGDYGSGKLSNIEWGSGVSETGKEKIYQAYHLTGSNQTAEKAAAAVAEDSSPTKAHDLAALLEQTEDALGTGTSLTYSQSIVINGEPAFKGYQATDLATGYYLIINRSVPEGTERIFSDYIVELVNDVAVEPKCEKPSSEKKVQDINDSAVSAELSSPGDSADYDIGDVIPFTLTAVLPADYGDYETYYLKFEDDMSAGLTMDQTTARISFGDTQAQGGEVMFQTSSDSSYSGGTVYSYAINNLKAARPNLSAGDTITIRYSAILNRSAVAGNAGNPNKFRIVFSNDKNHSGPRSSTSTTPWDINTVFTYKTVFTKVDGNHQELTGADFKLEKKVNGTYTDVTTLGTGTDRPYKNGSTSGSVFSFTGLDDGDYRLTEITTPAGYNTISPIEFTITAEHQTDSDTPTLVSLSGTDGAEFIMTENLSEGSLSAQIVNKSGVELPSTGGRGTALFKLAGLTLLVGTGVFMVLAKRRQSRQ